MQCKSFSRYQQKWWRISDINVWNFNETLTNDVVSFEQPGPGIYQIFHVWNFNKRLTNDVVSFEQPSPGDL